MLGAPSRRPTREAVIEGLRSVGADLEQLEPAAVDARGSTPYFGTLRDGTRLFVKTLGEDERSADLLFRLYRRIQPRDLHDERPFSSLRRTVEHEALVAVMAGHVGVLTPPIVAFAPAHPNGYTLAYEAVAGHSLDGEPDGDGFDDLVRAVWVQVAILRRSRIAHRDLRLANVFVRRGPHGAVDRLRLQRAGGRRRAPRRRCRRTARLLRLGDEPRAGGGRRRRR